MNNPYTYIFRKLTQLHSIRQHLEDFVSGSGEAGFIYVSMGTSVKTRHMPERIFQLFVDTFSKLPYRVLWKYDGMPGFELPSNVKVERWLPQQDILGKLDMI